MQITEEQKKQLIYNQRWVDNFEYYKRAELQKSKEIEILKIIKRKQLMEDIKKRTQEAPKTFLSYDCIRYELEDVTEEIYDANIAHWFSNHWE